MRDASKGGEWRKPEIDRQHRQNSLRQDTALQHKDTGPQDHYRKKQDQDTVRNRTRSKHEKHDTKTLTRHKKKAEQTNKLQNIN